MEYFIDILILAGDVPVLMTLRNGDKVLEYISASLVPLLMFDERIGNEIVSALPRYGNMLDVWGGSV